MSAIVIQYDPAPWPQRDTSVVLVLDEPAPYAPTVHFGHGDYE
jgi:hypothetical protein